MKIAHLIFSFTIGGAESMLVDIVNEQVKQAKVSIVIINKIFDITLVEKIDKRVTVYFINREVNSKNPFKILKLNLLLLTLRANVLHCHNDNMVQLVLPHFKKKAVLTLHSMGIPTIFLNKYKKLFAISESVKKDIISRVNTEVIVIYNGIPTKLIEAKENLLTDSTFKIIAVGRLNHAIKGQHLAIEALHVLKGKGIINLRLDIIGSGESEVFLKRLTYEYGIADQINFLGLKDRDYIYSHLKEYDLLIQPSLFEGFGLTVVEGMAAKIPVLVSDIQGPMEIIGNGKYGFHFKSGYPLDLAKQLKSIIEQHTSIKQKQIIEEAYQHIVANFEITKTVDNYITNY